MTKRCLARIRRASFLSLAPMLLWGGAAFGQSRSQQRRAIEGVVVDSGTRVPLSGVLATAWDSSGARVATAMSDRRGHFQLTSFSARSHAIVLTRAGYMERRVAVPSDSDVQLQIAMRARGVEFDPVQITASHEAEATLVAPV